MSLSSVFGQKADPVQFVLSKVGADVSSRGFVDKPAAIAESVEHNAKALEFYSEAKQALAARLDNNSPATNDPSFNNNSLLNNPLVQQGVGLAVVAGLATFAPVTAAAVGVGLAMKEGMQSMFSANSQDMATVHAGTINTAIDGGGTMGLSENLHTKKDRSSANDEGYSSKGYTDIMGDSWTMSGQRASAPPVTSAPPSQPLIDPRRMGAAADLAMERFEDREIRESISSVGHLERERREELAIGLRKMDFIPPANAPQFRMGA